MSHVDEGRLHAYLDGEVDAAGRADLEAHLAACRACRGELDEARALREESRFLLRGTGPSAIEEPPFGLVQARADRERGRLLGSRHRLLRGAAWAASLIVALGLGWFGRTLLTSGERSEPLAATESTRATPGPAAAAGAAADLAVPVLDGSAEAASRPQNAAATTRPRETTAPPVATREGTGADSLSSRRVALEEVVVEGMPVAAEPKTAAFAPSRERAAEAPAAREPAARLAHAMHPDPVGPPVESVTPVADASEARSEPEDAIAWRPIDEHEAADLLGHDPYLVPDLEVIELETTAVASADEESGGVVRVRQRLDDGGEIELYQRREEPSKAVAAPRRGGNEPTGAVTPPPPQPTPRPPTAPSPTPSGKPEPAKPSTGNGGLGSILDLFRKDRKQTGKAITDIPWLVRFTPEGDATMLAGSVRITAHAPIPKDRLRALLERVK